MIEENNPSKRDQFVKVMSALHPKADIFRDGQEGLLLTYSVAKLRPRENRASMTLSLSPRRNFVVHSGGENCGIAVVFVTGQHSILRCPEMNRFHLDVLTGLR
jgi:hypothetical protein